MKYRILITEDDPTLTSAYSFILGPNGNLTVDFAKDLAQAYAFINQYHYDAALFDIELSDDEENGIDLLEDMKQIQPLTPVMMMSSKDDPDTIGQCIAKGAELFASKNCNFLPSFARQIERLLRL